MARWHEFSRAYSIVYNEELSVGRVQTPTLAMIVDRKLLFVASSPKTISRLLPHFRDEKSRQGKLSRNLVPFPSEAWQRERRPGTGISIACRWRRSNRIVLRGRTGKTLIESLASETKRMQPPLPYDLTELQRHANRLFSFSAQQTLDLARFSMNGIN